MPAWKVSLLTLFCLVLPVIVSSLATVLHQWLR
jgi:hypothetical protein